MIHDPESFHITFIGENLVGNNHVTQYLVLGAQKRFSVMTIRMATKQNPKMTRLLTII